LEKAFAKLNVNYANLNGGNPVEALRALSGMPVEDYKTIDLKPEELWEVIHAGQKKDYVMTAACHRAVHGLISGHAYTLLDSVELEDKDKNKKIHLVQMRNPWGKEKYTGPWRDDDDRWTDDLKSQVNLTRADDGIFYMRYQDFKKAFPRFQVAMYSENWKKE
jgi:calpain-15